MPAASAQPLRLRIDLGYLDERQVQEQVVAREEYRRKVAELSRTYGRIMERAQALDYATKKLSGVLTEELVRRCEESGAVLQMWTLQIPGSLRYATEQAQGLADRIQRGGYTLTDNSIAAEYAGAKRAIDRLDADITGAERRLRDFCACLGVKFTIQNPRGETVFSTSVDLHI